MERDIFDEEHHIFRESARAFFQQEVLPNREKWHKAGIVDRDLFRKAGQQGFLLSWVDEKYGGLGIGKEDFRYELILIEENAKYGDAGFYLSLHSRLVPPYIVELGTEEQKMKYLPKCASGDIVLAIAMTEPDAGSDVAGMRTRAVDMGDHYVINGSKTYISNGINADLVIVAAKTNMDSSHGLSLFLVEATTPGFSRGRNLEKMGQHAQDTAELFFDNMKVPKDALLGELDQGFYYLMRFLGEERLITASGSLANAQHSFDITMDFIKERKAFGQYIGDFQNTRFKMAEMRTELDMCQLFLDYCVKQLAEGKLTAALGAQIKLMATELEWKVVDQCLQFHGGAGYMQEYEICNRFLDARVGRIYAGSSEIMKEIIARAIGLDPRKKKSA